ncbi:MAG: hypothetical protein ACJ8KO_09770 [Sulfurifustaceae bacterium]
MREFIDPRGNAIRALDADEIPKLETALVGMLGMEYDPLEHLRRKEDTRRTPASFFLECVVRLASMENQQINACREILAIIEARDLCRLESEWLHFGACKKWASQDFEGAHADWRRLLGIAPRDILALYGIHMLEFNMGWSSRMKETMRLVSAAWHPGSPLFGYVKGIEAFALTENGQHEDAWIAAARALHENPRDIYAFHAACHVHYETGRYEDAILWMNDRRGDWADNRGMRIHIWWHHALFQFYMLDVEKVFCIFREKIRDKNDPDGYEDLDAVSLLWRLSLIGIDVGELWQEVAQYWMPSIDQSQYWFNDVHAMMAMVSSNHGVLIQRILRHVANNYRKVPKVAAVTKTVCQGLIDFGHHDYESAYETIIGVLGSVSEIGGSNAQRDLLEMTAIEAALRCGRKSQARRLISNGRSLRHASPLRDLYLKRADAPDHRVLQGAVATQGAADVR